MFLVQLYHRPKKTNQPIVFLDRDGTIIREVGHLNSRSQIKIFKNAVEGIKIFNRCGYQAVVVSNQSVVARGLLTRRGLLAINDYLYREFRRAGAEIAAFYSCPHLRGCRCRKPKTAMYQKAVLDFKTDFKRAIIIGDMTTDIQAGKNLNVPTILLKTGHAGRDRRYQAKPDYEARNLLEAAKLVKF